MTSKQIAELREEYPKGCSRNVGNFSDIVTVNQCLDEIERLKDLLGKASWFIPDEEVRSRILKEVGNE